MTFYRGVWPGVKEKSDLMLVAIWDRHAGCPIQISGPYSTNYEQILMKVSG